MAYTKGPWKAERSNPMDGVDGWWLKDSPESTQYEIDIGWINGGEEFEANAHLIAAAPDMYEALKSMIKTYTELVNCGDCGNWNPEKDIAIINARAAISKAEGE